MQQKLFFLRKKNVKDSDKVLFAVLLVLSLEKISDHSLESNVILTPDSQLKGKLMVKKEKKREESVWDDMNKRPVSLSFHDKGKRNE